MSLTHFLLTTIMAFTGLAIALAVLAANFVLLRGRKKGLATFNIVLSAFYSVALVMLLVRQASGIACSLTPGRDLLPYAALGLLHLYFLWISVRLISHESP